MSGRKKLTSPIQNAFLLFVVCGVSEANLFVVEDNPESSYMADAWVMSLYDHMQQTVKLGVRRRGSCITCVLEYDIDFKANADTGTRMFMCHGDTNVVLVAASDASVVAACPPG